MLILTFLGVFTFSGAVHAFFGTLGRDQCSYQQQAYPVQSVDAQQALNTQIQGLESQRQQLEQRFNYLSSEALQLQARIRGSIRAPWSETMLAHMDNGFDCCTGSNQYSSIDSMTSNRRPAGQDLPGAYEEVTAPAPVPVDPAPSYAPPAPAYTPPQNTGTSCQGYDGAYCSQSWGPGPSTAAPGGGLCLQTGFAATPAWYQAACRHGGRIDPQVCSNPQIAVSPADYQMCVSTLTAYETLSIERRQLGAHIQQYTAGINNLRSGGAQYTSASSGETTGGGFLSGIGNFLGEVVSTVGPFMLNQYLSRQTPQVPPQVAQYGPRRPVTNVDGTRTTAPTPFYNTPQAAPPYYGPQYGYGLSYGGRYGGQLPGFSAGGFGCSQGVLGAGMNILGMLLGGSTGLNMNANIQSTFGANGGFAPFLAYLTGYGNQYSGVPPHTFPGFMPPYQPGSIYGTHPHTGNASLQLSIPSYYAGFQLGGARPTVGGVLPTPYSYGNTPVGNRTPVPGLGSSHNSFYYSQRLQTERMMYDAQADLASRQLQLGFQASLQNPSVPGYSHTTNWAIDPRIAQGYQTPAYLQPTSSNLLLQSLLGGGLNFNFGVSGSGN